MKRASLTSGTTRKVVGLILTLALCLSKNRGRIYSTFTPPADANRRLKLHSNVSQLHQLIYLNMHPVNVLTLEQLPIHRFKSDCGTIERGLPYVPAFLWFYLNFVRLLLGKYVGIELGTWSRGNTVQVKNIEPYVAVHGLLWHSGFFCQNIQHR